MRKTPNQPSPGNRRQNPNKTILMTESPTIEKTFSPVTSPSATLYTPPEQVNGVKLDSRTDLYSACRSI